MYAVGGSLLGQLLVIYVPFFQAIFQTEALSLWDWAILLAVGCPVLVADEVRKFFLRRRHEAFPIAPPVDQLAIDMEGTSPGAPHGSGHSPLPSPPAGVTETETTAARARKFATTLV